MLKDTADRHIYTVSEITHNIKAILQNAFGDNVWVEGEISNFNHHSSGHFYFSLKEESDLIAFMKSLTDEKLNHIHRPWLP